MSHGNIPGRANAPVNGRTRAQDPGANHFRDRAPSARNEFERGRFELNAEQMDDLRKTEAQRRREGEEFARKVRAAHEERSKARDSQMVKKDRPHPELKPSPGLAAGVDRTSFMARLSKERKAASRAQPAPARSSGHETFIAVSGGPQKSMQRDRSR